MTTELVTIKISPALRDILKQAKGTKSYDEYITTLTKVSKANKDIITMLMERITLIEKKHSKLSKFVYDRSSY